MAIIEWNIEEGDNVKIPKSISDTLGWVISKGDSVKSEFDSALSISQKNLYSFRI